MSNNRLSSPVAGIAIPFSTLPIIAICYSQLIFLDFITRAISARDKDYEYFHYAILSSLVSPP
jgi:hypothetical protein